VDLSQLIPAELLPLFENPWFRAGAILVCAVVLAKVIDYLACGCVTLWARKTKSDLDDRLIDIAHGPVFVSVLLVGIALAALQLQLSEAVSVALFGTLKTIAIWVWLFFSLRASKIVLEVLSRKRPGQSRRLEPQIRTLLENAAKIFFVGGAIYLLLHAWGKSVTTWLTSAGIVGIALGFAAKDTLANLFSGIFILADAPYRVGDFVNLDSGERGRVTQIGLRSTRLLTRDDIEITVPNAVIANAKIVNESGGPWTKERLRVKVSAAYGSDVDEVRETLLSVTSDNPDIVDHPEPRVRLRALGNYGLEFELLGWIGEPVDRGRVLDALYTEVYRRFNKRGIEIPFPTTTIIMQGEEDGPSPAADPDSTD